MSDSLILILDDELRFVGVDTRRTPGLAHQQALKVTDAGYRARVIEPDSENYEDVLYFSEQIRTKRQLGFIPDYGYVPNGNRSRGDGARTIGRMIYPPLGVMIEGNQNSDSVKTGTKSDEVVQSPLPSSSTQSENQSQKIVDNPNSEFIFIFGGKN